MRKVNPNDVKGDFRTFINDQIAYFDRSVARITAGQQHADADLSILAETTLHSAYVGFERFVSDLLIAYVNRDFSQYQASLKGAITNSVNTKFGAFGVARMAFTPIKHIKLDDLEVLVDPEGWNQTFSSVEKMKARFNDWVTPALRAGVTAIDDHNTKFIDSMRSIRNFIAHGSKGSKDIMNAALADIATGSPINAPLARGQHKLHVVGAYLKAKVNGVPRVNIYMTRIRDIAQTM